MKEKFSKIALGIILLISFCTVLKINLQTHIYHDEFVYSSIYGTYDRIENLADVFVSTFNLYLTHNGRAITHFILMVFLMCGSVVRSIINSMFFVLLIYELICFTTKKNLDLKIALTVLMFPLLWYTIPSFADTIIWIAGSVNYLWTTVLLLCYIDILDKIFNKESEFKGIKTIGFCLFSFIIASLHEMTGVISIAMIGLISLYLLIKNRKINKTLFLGGVFACLGFLFIIVSPGSNVRKLVELQTMDVVPSFLVRLQNCFFMLFNTVKNNIFIFSIVAILIVYIATKFIKNFKKTIKDKNICLFIFLLISSILSYIAMVVSPTFLERVTFMPYIIFIYASFKLLSTIKVNDNIKILESICIIGATVFYTVLTVPSIKETFIFLNEQYIAWNNRDNEISKQISEGKKDIYIEPLGVRSNSHLYCGEFSNSISYNHNGSASIYYGVNSIRIKENYYLDIELEDVNLDNTDSLKVSSNNYEETKKFYLIDKDLYDKTAPYKKFKNTYNGGDITLYYGFEDKENLEITSLKSQKITIHKIKLYTPDNIILDLEGEDILKYFNLENMSIEEINSDRIIVNAKENSKIIVK